MRHIEDASKLKKYFTWNYKGIHNVADKADIYRKDCTESKISENRGCWFWQSAQPQNRFGKKREFSLPVVSYLKPTWFVCYENGFSRERTMEKNPIGLKQTKIDASR